MIRPAARPLSRLVTSSQCVRLSRPRRLINTASPAQKSRSWKSSAVRWGIAATLIYYYNTSNLFAEEPEFAMPAPPLSSAIEAEVDHPTLSEISARKQKRKQASSSPAPSVSLETSSSSTSLETPLSSSSARVEADTATPSATPESHSGEGVEELEEEASQEGAFNPETGEINWDCPCLGGMAHGPCGEEFKTAFSCFVYSTEEPKGMDCIDKFKGMQDCFRKHPDIYGDPDAEEDEDDEQQAEIERAIDESTDSDADSNSSPNPTSRTQPISSLASGGQNIADRIEGKAEDVGKSKD